MPGRVHNRDNGDVACDHYHRWEQDLDLIKELGVEAYRFSIAWPRVYPDGTGPLNEKAWISTIARSTAARRAHQDLCDPYHWDLPLALMGDGGWTARSTAHAFQRYAIQ